jgi:hypothetical protein
MSSHLPSRPTRRPLLTFAAIGSILAVAVLLAPVAGAAVSPMARGWRIESSPNPAGASASGLDAVSCSAPDDCVAVGSAAYPSGHQLPHQLALIERFSSGTWTIVSGPRLPGATASPLDGVSCPLTGFCVAVGDVQYANPPAFDALAETWNGTAWKADSLPTPAGGEEPSLVAVSCEAEGACVAVGDYIDSKTDNYRLLAERLDGDTWSVVPAPEPHGVNGNSEFTGVDCATPTLCEVVGIVAYNDTVQSVIAYGLSGSTWTAQRQVNPGQPPGDTDNGVSCSTAGACTSVGSVYVVQESSLVEYWNGSRWVRQTTPAPVNRPETTLYGVSCVGGTSCVAVGASARINEKNGHFGPNQAMAVVWNGTSWSQSPPKRLKGMTITLSAISCTSPMACIAVGGSSTESSASTLIEAYTG